MKQRLTRDMAAALPACLITFLLFLLCSRVYGLFPCGSNSVVWCDMEQQAVPLLVQFRQLMRSGETLSYSLLNAGGMQFYGVFFFFLSNPLSFLVLVGDTPADLLVNLLVYCKLALASGTAALWLRRRVPALETPMLILLAVMYGCSGYGLFYYQNLMWLDIMLTVPLLMLALRHLLGNGSALPYFLVLCTMMVFCFYLCYMIVLFVLLYMALSLRFTVSEEQRGRIAGRFWGTSLLAAAVTAVIWLPCFLQVMHSARSDGVISRLMQSYLFNNLQDKLSLLCCTALIFAAIPALFCADKNAGYTGRTARDRRLFFLLLAALALDPINMMWHTGSYQAFPLRWGMIPVLLLLTSAAEQFAETPAEPKGTRRAAVKPVLRIVGILTAVIASDALLVLFAKEKILSYIHSLWVSIPNFLMLLCPALLLFCGYFLLLKYRRASRISLRSCTLLAALLFCAEFAMNFHCYIGAAANDDSLFAQTMSAEGQIPEDNDDLARLRLMRKYAHANMVGALGYPTMAHYTSMTRSDYMYAVKRMGYSSYWMEVNSVGGTVLTDALWHIRYLLGTLSDFPPGTEQIWTNGSLAIAENSLLLPPVIALDAAPSELETLPDGRRIGVQQFLGETLLGLEDFITEYPCTIAENAILQTEPDGHTACTLENPDENGSLRYSMFVRGRQALYFDLYSQTETEIKTPRDDAVSIAVNGKTIEQNYPQSNRNGLIFLGEFENSYVSVRVKVHQDFNCESFGIFGMDMTQIEEAILAADGTDVSYAHGTYTAKYHADTAKTLLFSAAYDEGFTAEVNGKSVPVYRVCGCMAAVTVPAGDNTVVMKFHVSGLRTGCLIAGAGLLLAAILWVVLRHCKAAALEKIDKLSLWMLRAAYAVILAAVYCLPVILWAVGSVHALF